MVTAPGVLGPAIRSPLRRLPHEIRPSCARRSRGTGSAAAVTECGRGCSRSHMVLRREVIAELDSALATLSADQERCVRLRFFAQLSVAETARVMGRGETAVRALQHRAMVALAGRWTGASS